MINPRFEKEAFKKDVEQNVKQLFRKTVDEASQQELYQAVSYVVKDAIIDDWIATQKQYEKDDPKIVYYMSMEFLLGRALGNNLINMTAYKEVKEALEEMGLNLNELEDQEPDPALGNGGLGRLAACFLDSLASLGYAAYGCGIRYRYGMFKQKIKDGYQEERPDNWLKNGNPFELRRPEYAKEVRFGGNIRVEYDDKTGDIRFKQENYESVLAVLRKLLKYQLVEVADIVYSGTVLSRSYRPTITSEEFAVQELTSDYLAFQKTVSKPLLVSALLDTEEDPVKARETIDELQQMLDAYKKELE